MNNLQLKKIIILSLSLLLFSCGDGSGRRTGSGGTNPKGFIDGLTAADFKVLKTNLHAEVKLENLKLPMLGEELKSNLTLRTSKTVTFLLSKNEGDICKFSYQNIEVTEKIIAQVNTDTLYLEVTTVPTDPIYTGTGLGDLAKDCVAASSEELTSILITPIDVLLQAKNFRAKMRMELLNLFSLCANGADLVVGKCQRLSVKLQEIIPNQSRLKNDAVYKFELEIEAGGQVYEQKFEFALNWTYFSNGGLLNLTGAPLVKVINHPGVLSHIENIHYIK
ncbi:hypothetical protein A9Q84_13230 [Halobacteriovorax marinus]|uniref:Lipoprotein n=1 Tax=Halobacteriovorax marinus TaxID=97084 RepID=A0A1Y5F8S8_9BACT|nr:hypothetical protein A9Q84_13230 [Halobacteriovorax marinus]